MLISNKISAILTVKSAEQDYGQTIKCQNILTRQLYQIEGQEWKALIVNHHDISQEKQFCHNSGILNAVALSAFNKSTMVCVSVQQRHSVWQSFSTHSLSMKCISDERVVL